jgi:protein phosphatase 1 regulatory subunit 11
MSEGAAPPRAAASTVTTSTTEAPQAITLRLRAPRRVRFDETAVDNEHLGRKKSKKCCIYHRRRAFDESSDESGDECADCAPSPGENAR